MVGSTSHVTFNLLQRWCTALHVEKRMNIIILKHKQTQERPSCVQAESPTACLKNVSHFSISSLLHHITRLDNTIMGTEENSNYKPEGHNVIEWLREQALELDLFWKLPAT